MVVRLLAMELYKLQQKVHKLRDQVGEASGLELEKIKRELAVAEHECEQMRRRIDSRKGL
jgi:hypothetical protein